MAKKEQRIAQLEDKLRRLKAQKKEIDRREETRRKILYGAAFLALADTVDEPRRQNMMNRVQEHITRPTDRAFLGLPPLPASDGAPSNAPADPPT